MTGKRVRRQRRSDHPEERLAAAMAAFSLNYGRDDTKLGQWQLLCDDCGVSRGSSITRCKAVSLTFCARCIHTDVLELLRTVAVNIWDLIKARAAGLVKDHTYIQSCQLVGKHPGISTVCYCITLPTF